MAVKKIITTPDKFLLEKSKPAKLDKKTSQLVADLLDTVRAQTDPEGVGLSAVQIGVHKRVFVVKLDGKFAEFVNPEIISHSPERTEPFKKAPLEGCLSVPGYYAFIDRWPEVELKWQGLAGQNYQQKFTGKEAVFIQHEYDHLNGVLFTQRALEQGQKIYQVKNEELVEIQLQNN